MGDFILIMAAILIAGAITTAIALYRLSHRP
jgi:hypothetical protein